MFEFAFLMVVAGIVFFLALLPTPKSYAERAGERLRDWLDEQIRK